MFMGKMFVVTHKNCSFKLPLNYSYFYVGKISNSAYLKDYVFRDNFSKINISDKNANYCELTALFSIVNDKNLDFVNVGLSHYRRFFYNPFLSLFKPNLISVRKLDKILKKFDIVIPYCDTLKKSVFDYYSEKHYQEDLLEIKKILEEKFTDYILPFDDFMSGNKTSHFNMFYASKELITKYANWVFDILFELEKRINLNERDDYQKRVFGFLSERLFNIWILKNNLKIKYAFVCNMDEMLFKNNLKAFRKIIHSKKSKF